MKRSLIYIGCTSLSLISSTWSSLTVVETEAEVVSAITKTQPVRSIAATDSISIDSIDGITATELDGARLETILPAAATSQFFYSEGADVYALSTVGNAWRTFKVTTAASYSATGNIDFAEVIRDGTANPGSAYSLRVALTKTGTPADLTRALLIEFLEKVNISALVAAGTTLASSRALPAGWAATGMIRDGTPAGIVGSLAAAKSDITLSVRTKDNVAISYVGTVIAHLYNVAANSTTAVPLLFTSPGRVVKLSTLPGKFVKTADIRTGMLTALNAAARRLSQSNKAFLPTIEDAVNNTLNVIKSTAANVNAGLIEATKEIVLSSNFLAADFTTTADTNKIGVIALGNDSITTATWSVNGAKLIVKGTIGSQAPKEFTCDLNGLEVAKTGTNEVLTFLSPDSSAVFLKVLDATGYDTSASTDAAAGEKDTLLALKLHSLVSGITTITAKSLVELATAAKA